MDRMYSTRYLDDLVKSTESADTVDPDQIWQVRYMNRGATYNVEGGPFTAADALRRLGEIHEDTPAYIESAYGDKLLKRNAAMEEYCAGGKWTKYLR